MKKLEKIRKNSTFMDKVCIFILMTINILFVPIGAYQFVRWYEGMSYSMSFIAMGLGLVFLTVAKFRAIIERKG